MNLEPRVARAFLVDHLRNMLGMPSTVIKCDADYATYKHLVAEPVNFNVIRAYLTKQGYTLFTQGKDATGEFVDFVHSNLMLSFKSEKKDNQYLITVEAHDE